MDSRPQTLACDSYPSGWTFTYLLQAGCVYGWHISHTNGNLLTGCTQTCASNVACASLSRLVMQAGLFCRTGGQMSFISQRPPASKIHPQDVAQPVLASLYFIVLQVGRNFWVGIGLPVCEISVHAGYLMNLKNFQFCESVYFVLRGKIIFILGLKLKDILL